MTAFTTFIAAPPSLASARALTLDRASGLELVATLSAQHLRAHLEALGEVASDKEVKKAAKTAAYKLKSLGITDTVQREAAVDLAVQVPAQHSVAATAPGFDGRLWLLLPTLPGVTGLDLDLRDLEKGPRIEPSDDLSVARIRRFVTDVARDRPQQPPVLIGHDAACRLIERTSRAATLAGKALPPAFAHAEAWHRRAIALGADPARASARAALAPQPLAPPETMVASLAAHPLLPPLMAPSSAFDDIDGSFRALLHDSAPIEKDAFLARGKVLVHNAAHTWWASAHGKPLAALWLDATADLLWSEGDSAAAAIALAAADTLLTWAGDPLEHPLIHRAFVGAIDLEAAWLHRQAHVRGDAHHAH